MNLAEQYDGMIFSPTCHVQSKLSIGTQKSGLMHVVVQLTNPDWRIVRIKRNNSLHSCSARTQSWCQNHSNLMFFDRDTVELERTHLPDGQLFQLFINLRDWSMDRRIKSDKHETSLFLLASKSVRFVIDTADDQLDRTSS